MDTTFDSDKVVENGWRQGSILDTDLATEAFKHAPGAVTLDNGDLLILTSHDCDIANFSIDKEPVVEVLRARVAAARKVDKQQSWGRNPRTLQLVAKLDADDNVLSFTVHDRWAIPRHLLQHGKPKGCLPDKERRLIAEWLAKRYIRAAFPTAFDARWRAKLKEWQKLLKKHSEWIQGVYLRLDTLNELQEEIPYKCDIILAVPYPKCGGSGWPEKRGELEQVVQAFWDQFRPAIECVGVEVHGTDEITLADIELYQRFDADWVSFADDTSATPAVVDMTS